MHCINLRHPWKSEVQDDLTRWSRKFNWPAELEVGEVVELVIEPASLATMIILNDQSLEIRERTEITPQLKKSNRLVIITPAGPDALPFAVKLEIKASGRES